MNGKQRVWWLIPLCGVVLAGLAAGVVAAKGHDGTEDKATHSERVIVFSSGAHLGVGISDVTAERAAALKLPAETGVVVDEVEEDSPAAKAGLAANDVILSFAGEPVRSAAQLRRLVQETPGGRTVKVEVSRAGHRRTFEVTLEERQTHFRAPMIRIPRVRMPHIEIPDVDVFVWSGRARLGISGDELTPQLAEYFGVKEGKGVLVREVTAGGAADKAGLKAGDVIVRVGDEEVGTVSELRNALASAQHDAKEVTLLLAIVRDRREQTLNVTLEEPQRLSPRPRRTAEVDILFEPDAQLLELRGLDEASRILEMKLREAEKRIQHSFESQEWNQKLRQLEQNLKKMEKSLETVDII